MRRKGRAGEPTTFPPEKSVANRSDEGPPRFRARSGTASNQCHCQKYASAEGDTPALVNLRGRGLQMASPVVLVTRCRDHEQTLQLTGVLRLEHEHAGARVSLQGHS